MKQRWGWRALAFTTVSAVLLAAVGLVMGEFRFDRSNTYYALFTNSSGLDEGDQVRAAGVEVGRVKSVELLKDDRVRIGFSAAREVPLPSDAGAAIRYRSLTGVKYLELQGSPSASSRLSPGDTIPVERTDSGLDLDTVFNGFKPLLQGLSPDQINQLSGSIIEVFEGQAGAIGTLLGNLGQLTSTVADRDEVIGDLITNFRDVIGDLDTRGSRLSETAINLRTLVSGLAADRKQLVNSLVSVGNFANEGARFIALLRPDLVSLVQSTKDVTTALNSDLPLVDHYLKEIPRAIDAVGTLGAYGSFYNVYICSLTVKLSAPGGSVFTTPTLQDKTPRCQVQDGDTP